MAKFLNDTEIAKFQKAVPLRARRPERAVALGGGGPAVGISIGFLQAVEEWNDRVRQRGEAFRAIEFPIWVAGCVGGWLACLYHLCPSPKAQKVEEAIRAFFRENDMYEHFPAPKTFTPDIPEQIEQGLKFLVDPQSYKDLVVPREIAKGYLDIVNYYLTPSKWNRGDFSYLLLNSVLAPNPAARLMMSLLYKTSTPGLNKLWFGPDYSVLKNIEVQRLATEPDQPLIYINSYNMDQHHSDIYSNRPQQTQVPTLPLTIEALCASSALPYILSPVMVDGERHIEGALIDSFCFEAIHERHQGINEVWISQIVDHSQVRPPTNLLEALNNLIMLYAGTTSRHDVEMFVSEVNRHENLRTMLNKGHQAEPIECLQLPVNSTTTYLWSYENLDNSIRESKKKCLAFIEDYDRGVSPDGLRMPQRKNLFARKEPKFRPAQGKVPTPHAAKARASGA